MCNNNNENKNKVGERAGNSFFSLVHRMKYINRWGLMRNTRQENLAEHSVDVAIIAHALGNIANRRLHKSVDCNKLAMLAIFHDASEIITGDLPTPIKYHNDELRKAYKHVESVAVNSLLDKLPGDFVSDYIPLLIEQQEDAFLWELIKAADKISALIKCCEEECSGNTEFKAAKDATLSALVQLNLLEVTIFMDEFYPSFSKTLDEQ